MKLYFNFLDFFQDTLFVLPVFLSLFLCFCFDKKNHPTVFLLFLFLLMATIWLGPITLELKSECLIVLFVLLGFFSLNPSHDTRKLFWRVFLPSIFAGLITDWSSCNGWINLAVGFFPAFLVILIFEAMRVNRLTTLICINFFLIAHAWMYAYWDAPIHDLTTRIHSGPFQYLYTNPKIAKVVNDWQEDFSPYAHQGHTLFQYYNTPAILLINGLTPDTPSALILDPSQGYPEQNALQYFKAHQNPDFIVRMNSGFYMTLRTPLLQPPPPSLLDAFVKAHYHPIVMRPAYTLFQENHV